MAMATAANGLLTAVIDAHGGMARWREREKVEATVVSGGGFFPLKGVIQDSRPLSELVMRATAIRGMI